MRVYLSGAIEHAADGGKGWRKEIAALLSDDLGHEVYDPAADEKKNLSEEERANFRRWKFEDPERFREVIRKIIAWDLDRIENWSDCVVAFWDRAAGQGGGTASEITLAYRLGKPVFLLLGMPVSETSGWIFAAAEAVFEDAEELKAYLRQRFAP